MTQLTPPDAPSLTSVEPDGPNAIIVTWGEPWHLGDLPVTQYQVQWAKDPYSEIWRGPQTLSGSTRSWRHTGLKPGETWHYQVRASNGGGRWSVWSYSESTTTASEKVPTAAPSGLTATYDAASGSVTLKWNAPSGSAQITGYDLQYSEDNNQWEDLEENLNALTYTDDGYHLYPGSQIHYRVRARAAEGAGPWSRSVRVLVPADPPDAPRYRNVEADGSDHILIQWEAPYYDGGTAITGYRLLWCRALDGADENPCEVAESNSPADPPGYSRISLGASARSCTHSVSPGYYYHYLVRATNGGNRWSEWDDYDIFYARTYAGVPAAPSLRAQGRGRQPDQADLEQAQFFRLRDQQLLAVRVRKWRRSGRLGQHPGHRDGSGRPHRMDRQRPEPRNDPVFPHPRAQRQRRGQILGAAPSDDLGLGAAAALPTKKRMCRTRSAT